MTRSVLLANRLQEVLLDGYWIANTNCRQQIEGVTWQQATQKPEDLNSIAALIYHLNYYLAGILTVFNGGELKIRDQYSFNLPPIQSEADWERLTNEFVTNAKEFVHHTKNMPDHMLDEMFTGKKYGTYLRNIEGVIEHSYYHLGQISLIKKLVIENK
ncbi:DinB family protein [Ascidiimonas aurantiaca]|uniref:DinB family protein n=1 Tax=Ascidiimonas aurantiaca TaxID=1685432 RepID=UPI0030ED58B8